MNETVKQQRTDCLLDSLIRTMQLHGIYYKLTPSQRTVASGHLTRPHELFLILNALDSYTSVLLKQRA